jgi:hypothetical protein
MRPARETFLKHSRAKFPDKHFAVFLFERDLPGSALYRRETDDAKPDRDGGRREACSSDGSEWFDESQCLTQDAVIVSNQGTRNGVGFDHLTIAPSFHLTGRAEMPGFSRFSSAARNRPYTGCEIHSFDGS